MASDVRDRVPRPVFEGVVWMGVGLCTLAFGLRAYVRVACFRSLLLEDYLMLAALLMLVAFAVLCQVNMGTVYLLNHVLRGFYAGDLSLLFELGGFEAVLALADKALKTEGAALVLFIVGIDLIKLNFLVFFYRIGHRVRAYLIFWWVAFAVVLSCGIVGLAIIPYGCIFQPPLEVLEKCQIGGPYAAYQANVVKGSVVIDVVSDALVICFPVSILWNITVGLRQKVTLTAVFALVGLTIAVTIVRGQQFTDVDTTWAMFFFLIEYIVSFMIACVISFRSLWGKRVRRQMEDRVRRGPETTPDPALGGHGQGRRLRRRLGHLHDSLLDTFKDLEGTTLEGNDVDLLRLPMPASGPEDSHSPAYRNRASSLPDPRLSWAGSDGITPVGTQGRLDGTGEVIEPSAAPAVVRGDRRSRMEIMYI